MTGAAPDKGGVAPALPDDEVISFRTVASGALGRIVRLGPAVDDILSRHDYPEPVSRVLGQALALTAMLGSQLKFNGKLILQTNSDGPAGFLVVNYEYGGAIRGYASFDRARLDAMTDADRASEAALLGKGYLAMTIDPGPGMDRYQGIVALEGGTLTDAALEYFRRSEQLPTFIRLAVARHFAAGIWRWRAGGLMVQHLAAEGGHAEPPPEEAEARGWVLGVDDESWRRVEILAATVEDHELLDPTLPPERLLYRLFHEEGVRALPAQSVRMHCGCSREAVAGFIRRFPATDLADMKGPDGAITVTCEFCTTPYRFEEGEMG